MAGMRISLVWLLYTARKTIFSFPKCFEKMVFSKKLHGNMIFLVLFLFPENMIFFFERKVKDDLSQEINGNMIFSVYMYISVNMILPFCQKKIKDDLLRKKSI